MSPLASPGRRAAPRLLVLLLLALALVPVATARAAEPTATVAGTVRDGAGAPVAGARIYVNGPGSRRPAGIHPSDASWPWAAVSDATGAYEIPGVPMWAAGDELYESTVFASRHGYTSSHYLGREESRPFVAREAATYRADFVLHRIDAVIRGRVSIKGGASPEALRVYPERVGDPNTTFQPELVTHPDGRYELTVPAGRYRVGAESRYGLAGNAPDLPGVRTGPAFDLPAGGVREDVDVLLRARLPYPATDQYGYWQFGYEDGRVSDDPFPRYPRDETPSVLSTIGPVLEHGVPRTAKHNEPGEGSTDLTAGFFGLNVYRVRLHNRGDHDLWVRSVRFEGPDAGWFSCQEPYHGSGDVFWVGCDQGFVLPGETKDLPIQVRNGVLKAEFRATAVVTTSAPGGELRFPMVVRMPGVPSGALPTPPAGGAAPGTGSATPRPARPRPMTRSARSRLGRSVALAPTRVRVRLPGAGRVAVRIERRTSRAGRRGKTVRRATLRATRARTVTARLRRLPAGRYRVRMTVALAGHTAATVTVDRTVRGR